MRSWMARLAAVAAFATTLPGVAHAGAAGTCPLERLKTGLEAFGLSGKMDPDVRTMLGDRAAQRVAAFSAPR